MMARPRRSAIEPCYAVIGKWVLRARRRLGLRQQDLARALGVGLSTVHEIEHAKARIPVHHLLRLEALLSGHRPLAADECAVIAALHAGATTPRAIRGITGFNVSQVTSAVHRLRACGLIRIDRLALSDAIAADPPAAAIEHPSPQRAPIEGAAIEVPTPGAAPHSLTMEARHG